MGRRVAQNRNNQIQIKSMGINESRRDTDSHRVIITPMLYIQTWCKCFMYIDKADTTGLRVNNSLFSPIKFRVI